MVVMIFSDIFHQRMVIVRFLSILESELVLSFFSLIKQLIYLLRFSKKIRKVITHFFHTGGKNGVYSSSIVGLLRRVTETIKKPATMGTARA